MKTAILFLFLLLSHWSNGQKLSGTWQGACSTTDASNPILVSASWIYLDMTIVKGMIDGKMRHENSLEGHYYIYDIVGKVLENGHLEIKETKLGSKSKNAIPADKQQFDFEYGTCDVVFYKDPDSDLLHMGTHYWARAVRSFKKN